MLDVKHTMEMVGMAKSLMELPKRRLPLQL
jgi:hypothetical protein